ncbi:MAG: LUD domain-containing protein [Candidatus Heimdallarchaeota archaeon]
MPLSLDLPKTDLEFLKLTVLESTQRRSQTLSKIQQSIEDIKEILERDADYNRDVRIQELESNLVENKISFFRAQTEREIKNAIIEFLDLSNERNVLIELAEDLLVDDVYSMLSSQNIAPVVCHPSVLDTEPFNVKTGIKRLNYFPLEDDKLRYFYRKIREKSLYSSTGVSSADFLAFDTGTIIIRDLQRWRGILTTAPVKHLAVVNIDKAMKYHSILGFLNAMKIINPQYLDTNFLISSSPSRTGDIERILVYGAHGPLSVGVIAVDSEFPDVPGNRSDLYPLSLVLDALFPELKHIANFLDVPTINPITMWRFITNSNAQSHWALAHTVLNRVENSDLALPRNIINAYTAIKSEAANIGNLGAEETDRLEKDLYTLLTSLEVTRKD